jgi:hypothetical protein
MGGKCTVVKATQDVKAPTIKNIERAGIEFLTTKRKSNMQAKVTKLNKAINPGHIIPLVQSYGNIGRWVENHLAAQGYKINRGFGIDLKGLKLEIKTRDINATSAQTITSLSLSNLLTYDWKRGPARHKITRQYRVLYKQLDFQSSIVVESGVFDFTKSGIPQILGSDFDVNRQYFEDYVEKHGEYPKYVNKGQGWLFLERTTERKVWQVRVTNRNMNKLENMTKQVQLFDFAA